MMLQTVAGVLIPFIGTVLGGACVFFMKKEISEAADRIISGFAGGVMVAAAVFSLIIPAIEYSQGLGSFAFMPAATGFFVGALSIMLTGKIAERSRERAAENGTKSRLGYKASMVLAVTVHNFPEGMAVGVVYAGLLTESSPTALAGALALSLGIAIQNFPEGAIISMPMKAGGATRLKAFSVSVLSGIVEPIGAALIIAASSLFLPLLPYVLGFAAGAMVFAVVEDLMPKDCNCDGKTLSSLTFCIGFIIMIILDVSLG